MDKARTVLMAIDSADEAMIGATRKTVEDRGHGLVFVGRSIGLELLKSGYLMVVGGAVVRLTAAGREWLANG